MSKKLRICLDPRDLNEALEREPYYTCSIEEIIGKFHGMTRFTIADFNKGYWMVELDPESRKYTVMALDIGRFQWTQLPMGSIVAQDIFQRKLDAIFLDVPGVTGIADDMIIYGRSNLEHDKHLINFLEVCRKNTLTLNPDKMQFRLPQVSFVGHQWSAKGLSPDPKKIAAVKRMNLPQDMETMRSFLGLVNYLNRFSLHLAELVNLSERSAGRTWNLNLLNLYVLLFQGQKRKFPRMSHFHISILEAKPLCKPMPPRKVLEQSFYRIPNQSCLHQGH